jgi:hypothetical protein
MLDEVRVWQECRSDWDIAALKNVHLSSPRPGLVAVWCRSSHLARTASATPGNSVPPGASIPKPDAVDDMSVAALRRLVTDLGGDHSDCIEKTDLRKRARRMLEGQTAFAEPPVCFQMVPQSPGSAQWSAMDSAPVRSIDLLSNLRSGRHSRTLCGLLALVEEEPQKGSGSFVHAVSPALVRSVQQEGVVLSDANKAHLQLLRIAVRVHQTSFEPFEQLIPFMMSHVTEFVRAAAMRNAGIRLDDDEGITSAAVLHSLASAEQHREAVSVCRELLDGMGLVDLLATMLNSARPERRGSAGLQARGSQQARLSDRFFATSYSSGLWASEVLDCFPAAQLAAKFAAGLGEDSHHPEVDEDGRITETIGADEAASLLLRMAGSPEARLRVLAVATLGHMRTLTRIPELTGARLAPLEEDEEPAKLFFASRGTYIEAAAVQQVSSATWHHAGRLF